MLRKYYPTAADYENLSRVATISEAAPPAMDFTGVVVNKPWGYEYLWYQSPAVAIWMLHLKPGASTSLHCHVSKRTAHVILDGEVRFTTLDDAVRMQALDCVVLEPNVYHASEALTTDGAFLMEIETPPVKHDLVRLRDRYARAGTGYEGQSEYSRELERYEYRPLRSVDGAGGLQFRSVRFQLCGVADRATALALAGEHDLAIPLAEHASEAQRCGLQVGDVLTAPSFRAEMFPPRFAPVEILFCKQAS